MKPTDELVKEHNAILGSLEVLSTICDAIEAGKTFNAYDVGRLLDFLKVFADGCHHQKEELLLFPALEQSGIPREHGPIGVMLSEHDLGRKYIRGMAESLDAFSAGRGGAAVAIASNARAYINLLRAHIIKENTILFPMADKHLRADAQAELVAAFADLEEHKIGQGLHEQYHELLRELHDTYLIG